jgi:hypothetical protein
MSDFVVIGGGDDLETIGTSGVLDRLHRYAYSPIPEEDSMRARCRVSENVSILCNYIATHEKLKMTRVYPSIISVGYGMYLHNIREKSDLMSEVTDMLDKLRLSLDNKHRTIANDIQNITIVFQGTHHSYRFESTLVAQINEYAGKCGASAPDLYLYYFLIGLKELVENEDSLSQINSFKEYKRVMNDLEDVNDRLEAYKIFITY